VDELEHAHFRVWSQPNLTRMPGAKCETGLSPVGLMCSRDTSSSEVIAEGKVIVGVLGMSDDITR
jgi:hypothetical protein